MKVWQFGDHQFELAGTIQPDLDSTGSIVEYSHHLPAGVRPNRWASGPFCRFQLQGASTAAGVYAFAASDLVKYIGECANLARRLGPNGYGHIGSRNCHHDGQATNCKVNALVLSALKSGDRIDVWFCATEQRKTIERDLLDLLKPPWNRLRPKATGVLESRRGSALAKAKEIKLTVEDFRAELERQLAAAAREGKTSVRISAGELHRAVGGYPGRNHRMPMCCQAMRSVKTDSDKTVESPPKGNGARLTIEYRLPRS